MVRLSDLAQGAFRWSLGDLDRDPESDPHWDQIRLDLDVSVYGQEHLVGRVQKAVWRYTVAGTGGFRTTCKRKTICGILP